VRVSNGLTDQGTCADETRDRTVLLVEFAGPVGVSITLGES
jgi:hypothetical protein